MASPRLSSSLSVATGPAMGASGGSERAHRAAIPPASPAEAEQTDANRPTSAEDAAAKQVIAAMRESKSEPPLLLSRAAVDTKVVACALALYFGEVFPSDAQAKSIFGVGQSTDIRSRWVKSKLPALSKENPDALNAAASVFGSAQSAPDAPAPEAPVQPTVHDGWEVVDAGEGVLGADADADSKLVFFRVTGELASKLGTEA